VVLILFSMSCMPLTEDDPVKKIKPGDLPKDPDVMIAVARGDRPDIGPSVVEDRDFWYTAAERPGLQIGLVLALEGDEELATKWLDAHDQILAMLAEEYSAHDDTDMAHWFERRRFAELTARIIQLGPQETGPRSIAPIIARAKEELKEHGPLLENGVPEEYWTYNSDMSERLYVLGLVSHCVDRLADANLVDPDDPDIAAILTVNQLLQWGVPFPVAEP